MTITCPRCHSDRVETRNHAKRTGGAIGTAAGAASGAAGAIGGAEFGAAASSRWPSREYYRRNPWRHTRWSHNLRAFYGFSHEQDLIFFTFSIVSRSSVCATIASLVFGSNP